MKVNIGKNTLGDNDKMSVSLREYGRSTHDLSSAWRSPMGVGTLVPFMKLIGLSLEITGAVEPKGISTTVPSLIF